MQKLWKIDCTVMSDLRGKQKLHLGIQMLITAKSLINYIYIYIYILAPHEEAIYLEVVRVIIYGIIL